MSDFCVEPYSSFLPLSRLLPHSHPLSNSALIHPLNSMLPLRLMNHCSVVKENVPLQTLRQQPACFSHDVLHDLDLAHRSLLGGSAAVTQPPHWRPVSHHTHLSALSALGTMRHETSKPFQG